MSLDFLQSAPGADPVVVSAAFKVSPERLFAAWTSPDEVCRWFGPKPTSLARAEIDLRVGGAYRLVFDEAPETASAVHGAYVAIEPNRRLAFTWCWERADEGGVLQSSPISSVTVDFQPRGTGTLLSIHHAALAAEDVRSNVGAGWNRVVEHLLALLPGEAEAREG